MDLYPIALAIYALLVIITLASLKSTLREVSHDERVERDEKSRKMIDENLQRESNKKQKTSSCGIFKYFLRNYTFALIFGGRFGIQLLSMLFTYSVIGIFLFEIKFWYPAIGFGSITSSVSIILQILQQKSIKKEQSINDEQVLAKKWKLKKVLFVLIGISTVTLYLTLFGLCFKYYINSQLYFMLTYFGIVFAIDNLAVKPFILLTIALLATQNTTVLKIVDRDGQQKQINRVRVANNFEKQPQTKHHFVINLEQQPQHIDLTKSKEFNKCKNMQESIKHAPQALPSSSIIDTIQLHHEGSIESMLSRGQSRKSGLNKLTSMKELNEIQLQKIEENPGHELQQYFCINLRRQKQAEESKQLQDKIDNIHHSNPHNQNNSQLIKQFIFEDFICNSPNNEENIDPSSHQQTKNNSKYSKSKGSLRGAKTFRILQRQNDVELNDKQNTVGESTKHQISENQISYRKDHSFASNRRIDNKTHILKISDIEKETGELEEIDINSPNKRVIQKTSYDTHVIPEEVIKSKHKRNRRGTTKEISQPYLLQDKLIQVYFPGRNKSEFDNFVRSKKKNFDRSQFFNRSNKKEPSNGRQKPIVHENEDQHTEFFVPKF